MTIVFVVIADLLLQIWNAHNLKWRTFGWTMAVCTGPASKWCRNVSLLREICDFGEELWANLGSAMICFWSGDIANLGSAIIWLFSWECVVRASTQVVQMRKLSAISFCSKLVLDSASVLGVSAGAQDSDHNTYKIWVNVNHTRKSMACVHRVKWMHMFCISAFVAVLSNVKFWKTNDSNAHVKSKVTSHMYDNLKHAERVIDP